MKTYTLDEDEAVLYKGEVKISNGGKSNNSTTELRLTNKNIIINTKTKKLFRKEETDIEVYDVSKIKTYNDEPQIKCKHNQADVYFINSEISIEFPKKQELQAFMNQALKLLTGNSKFVRGVLKTKKSISETEEALNIDISKVAKNAAAIGLSAVAHTTAGSCKKPLNFIGNIAKQLTHNNTSEDIKTLPTNDNIDKLVKLKELLDSGAITEEEYNNLKKEII